MSNTKSIIQDLITLYESQKSQLQDEIRNYPPPIPACDAQFNYLLEKRDRLSVELNRLQIMRQTNDTARQSAQDFIDFMADSTVINVDAKREFRFRLQQLQE